MAELSESQLLLLDNLIYLDNVSNVKNKSVKEVVNDLLYKNGLEESQNPKKIGTDEEWPARLSKDEWKKVLTEIQKDPKLMELKITNGVDDDTGMRAACFVDANGDATAVFRGTSGDLEWHDDGQGGYLSDTKSQTQALDYINGLPYNNITVTGHSKGGNKAQYVTVLADKGKVDRCVSFDGQGFSKEFFEEHREDIAENRYKITSISAKSDFVNCLLFPVALPDNTKYIETESQDNFLHNHCPDIMLDPNGNLRNETEQDPKSKLINKYTEYVVTHYPEPERSFIINSLVGGLETGPQKEGDWQRVVSAIPLVDGLPGFAEDTAIHMIDDKVREILKEAGRFVEDRIDDAIDLAKDVGNSAKETLEDAEDAIKQGMENIGYTVADITRDKGNSIRDSIYGTGRTVNKVIEAVSSGIDSLLHINEGYDKDRIEVNITKLYETSEIYKNCRIELEGMLQELNTCMENLKAHWEGEAKESYFANAYSQFSESMKKHIAKIAFLEKELAGTAGDFQNLDGELRSKLA